MILGKGKERERQRVIQSERRLMSEMRVRKTAATQATR